jgi:TolB-like protein/Tfp pilus assembly protein PilF
MISGRLPFKGDYESVVVYSILNAQPDPLSGLRTGVPMELERIVNKALAKQPEERFQHVDELMVDLRRLTKESGSKAGPRVSDSKRDPRRSSLWKRPVHLLLGVLLAVALILAAVWFAGVRKAERPPAEERSIAVLPLNTLNKTEDDQAFADGIHGEILTHLTSIKEIKVKAQTSVLQYRDTRKSMKQIGQELGVSYLMEGSVQKAGGRIRIQAQLIDAQSEDHIWAETYEVPYGDIFAIQSDISEKIASQLRATLTPRERQLIARKPTENTEAYDFYLMGNHLWAISQSKEEDIRASELLEKAVALDPNYAVAWAKLSVVHCELMHYEGVRSRERMSQARVALEKAEALEPDLPEVHQAKGAYYYYAAGDSMHAFTEFQLALKDQPGNSEFLTMVGTLLASQGYEKEALEYDLAAYKLDPGVLLGNFVSEGYFCMGQFADAERISGIAIALEPRAANSYIWEFNVALAGRGDIPRAREVLEEAHRKTQKTLTGWQVQIDRFAGEYAAALSVCNADSSADPLMKADIYRLLGEHVKANKQALVAAAQYSKLVELQPDWEYNHVQLARAFAILRKRQDALREGNMVLHPGLKFSNNNGKQLEIGVMQVHLLLGDNDKAIGEIEELVSVPSFLTKESLCLDPIYDQLRSNPRFQALVAKGMPSTQ